MLTLLRFCSFSFSCCFSTHWQYKNHAFLLVLLLHTHASTLCCPLHRSLSCMLDRALWTVPSRQPPRHRNNNQNNNNNCAELLLLIFIIITSDTRTSSLSALSVHLRSPSSAATTTITGSRCSSLHSSSQHVLLSSSNWLKEQSLCSLSPPSSSNHNISQPRLPLLLLPPRHLHPLPPPLSPLSALSLLNSMELLPLRLLQRSLSLLSYLPVWKRCDKDMCCPLPLLLQRIAGWFSISGTTHTSYCGFHLFFFILTLQMKQKQSHHHPQAHLSLQCFCGSINKQVVFLCPHLRFLFFSFCMADIH